MADQQYSVHALRYAQSVGKRSSFFYRYDLSEQADAEQHVDWYFWLMQGGGKTVLVDCGYDKERGARKGRYQRTAPLELLSRAGVRAADVDHVVVSHMHYDHVGNIGLFPNATFSMARSEFEWMQGPYSNRFPTCWAVEPEEREMMQNLNREERITFVDDRAEVLPGISVSLVGGHTPGQTLTEVTSTAGQIVLASDAAHLYEEFETDRAFNMFHNLEDMYGAYERLRAFDDRPDTTVIPGHDPRVGMRFDQVEADCFDLTNKVTDN